MVIVHAENPQSPGQIHRQAAIAAVDAQQGGQVVGLRELSWGCEGQTCRPQQAAGREQQRECPHSSHPAAMLGQQGLERLGENGTGGWGGRGRASHTHTHTHIHTHTHSQNRT